MKKNPIKAGEKPLVKILLENQFIIPRHQRPYAWEEKHVKWLLDDIAYGVEKNKSYHYLGPIMLTTTNKKGILGINDGQQRIVTLALICAYLCKEFAGKKGYKNQAVRILYASQQTPRITLSKKDHMMYKFLISSGEPSKDKVPINIAWKTIDDFFKEKTLESKVSFFKFMRSRLRVSWTRLENKNDAITSFITQNARGKSLEQIQLTCAHFLRFFNNDDKRSIDMADRLDFIRDQFEGEKESFDYVRCFAQCEYGHLSSTDFCFKIVEKIKDSEKAYKFVHRLSHKDRIRIFKNLEYPKINCYKQLTADAGQKKSDRQIMDYLADLDQYKSVSNAIMFALICRYETSPASKKKEEAKFVYKSSKLLASFFQRAAHSVQGSFSPSKYEQGVASLANAIKTGNCTTPEEFLTTLGHIDRKGNIVSDSQYRLQMNSIPFLPRNKHIKNILIAINAHMEKDSLKKRSQRIIPAKVSIEHVLPESDHHLGGWDFNKAEHDARRYQLGNLALLPPDSKYSTDEFNANLSAKKKEYKKLDYTITKELSKAENWDVNAINSRGAKLAKIAAQVWNFNID